MKRKMIFIGCLLSISLLQGQEVCSDLLVNSIEGIAQKRTSPDVAKTSKQNFCLLYRNHWSELNNHLKKWRMQLAEKIENYNYVNEFKE